MLGLLTLKKVRLHKLWKAETVFLSVGMLAERVQKHVKYFPMQ